MPSFLLFYFLFYYYYYYLAVLGLAACGFSLVAAHGDTLWFWCEGFSSRSKKKGFPGGSDGKESACNAGDLGLIPGLGKSPRVGKVYPLQYPCLGNSMDCIDCGVAKSQTQLSDFHFTSLHGL